MSRLVENRIWRTAIVLYSALVSAGSLSAAAAILFVPDLAAGWMGVAFEPQDLIWHRYLAVFLGCVRLSFWIGLFALWSGRGWERLRFAWEYTTLVDLVIGLFVAFELHRGSLEAGWVSVVWSDLSAAAFQGAILLLGLLPRTQVPLTPARPVTSRPAPDPR